MKKFETFVCEICDRIYKSETEARNCEDQTIDFHYPEGEMIVYTVGIYGDLYHVGIVRTCKYDARHRLERLKLADDDFEVEPKKVIGRVVKVTDVAGESCVKVNE